MPSVTFAQPDGSEQRLEVPTGTTLMHAAVSNGIDGIIGECGGQAMCATCHVYVRPEFLNELPALGDDEDEMLDCTTGERTDRSRLGCQIQLSESLAAIVVDVPEGQG
jgi:ferredoxin, 2Fe-2S